MKKDNNIVKATIKIKDINEDFSEEINNNMKIVIYAEHSKSYGKNCMFENYITKKFNARADKYIIAKAQLDFIDVDQIDSQSVVEILRRDLNKVCLDFKKKYPDAKLEKSYSFNYALDYNSNEKKAEILSIALMRVTDKYTRVQYSPIIPLTEEKYLMLIGKKNNTAEGKFLNDILTEKIIGNELFGLIGYLTNGKFNTANLYTENLLDIIPEYKNEKGSRKKVLKYKKYKSTTKKYLESIKLAIQ